MRALLIFICMVAVLSCRTTKRTVEQQTVVVKDTASRVQATMLTSDSGSFARTVKDTSLHVPMRQVRDTITPDLLQPVFNSAGAEVPRPVTVQGKGVKVTLTRLPGGNVAVQGDCDSLNIALKGQIEETTYWKQKYESLDSNSTSSHSAAAYTISDHSVTSSINLWTYIGIIIISFGCGLLVGCGLLRKFIA